MLTPTGDFDAQIKDMLRGLNQIDRAKDDWVSDAGRKLIAIRQILQAKNGKAKGGRSGADGLCPAGWKEWCRVHGLSHDSATQWVRKAAAPGRYHAANTAHAKESYTRVPTFTRRLKRAWPNWTNEQRLQFVDCVNSLIDGE